MKENEKYFFINKNRDFIGKVYDFTTVGYFSENLARVEKNYLHGYMNKDGEIIIPLQFKAAKDFKNGFAQVRKKRLWGVIDAEGNLVIDYKFNGIEQFVKIE